MEMTKRKSLIGERYLSFKLMEEEYCISIRNVKEIMALVRITPLPQTPDFIMGVINLRGKIIPIIDLRIKFELNEGEYDDRTTIIVVEFDYQEEHHYLGIVVDATQEVLHLTEEDISKVPYINAKIKSEYIRGIAEYEKEIKIVLDIGKVLSDEDFILLDAISKSKQSQITEESDV